MAHWLFQQDVLAVMAVGGIIVTLMFLIPVVEDLAGERTRLGDVCGRTNLRWAVAVITVVAALGMVVV